MEMTFTGILHAKKSVNTVNGISGTVQVNCPLFETDVVALFKFHAAKLTLEARLNDKKIGMITGEMSGTRTGTTKEGTFLYIQFECVVDGDYQRLDPRLVGTSFNFVLTSINENPEQPELGE